MVLTDSIKIRVSSFWLSFLNKKKDLDRLSVYKPRKKERMKPLDSFHRLTLLTVIVQSSNRKVVAKKRAYTHASFFFIDISQCTCICVWTIKIKSAIVYVYVNQTKVIFNNIGERKKRKKKRKQKLFLTSTYSMLIFNRSSLIESTVYWTNMSL